MLRGTGSGLSLNSNKAIKFMKYFTNKGQGQGFWKQHFSSGKGRLDLVNVQNLFLSAGIWGLNQRNNSQHKCASFVLWTFSQTPQLCLNQWMPKLNPTFFKVKDVITLNFSIQIRRIRMYTTCSYEHNFLNHYKRLYHYKTLRPANVLDTTTTWEIIIPFMSNFHFKW